MSGSSGIRIRVCVSLHNWNKPVPLAAKRSFARPQDHVGAGAASPETFSQRTDQPVILHMTKTAQYSKESCPAWAFLRGCAVPLTR